MYKLLNQKGLLIATCVGGGLLLLSLLASSVDLAIRSSYFLVIVGAIAAIGLPLYMAKDNPKALIQAGVAVVGLSVLFGIIYATSSNEVPPNLAVEAVSEGDVQLSGAMISTMIFMLIAAFGAIVVTEVYNTFKK